MPTQRMNYSIEITKVLTGLKHMTALKEREKQKVLRQFE